MSTEPDTIQRCGDTELWVVSGEGWELPVLADPYGTGDAPSHYRLRPPLDAKMSVQMLKALDERLNPFKVPTAACHVIIKYEDLPRIASKAGGITPGYYIKWAGAPEAASEVEEERIVPNPPGPDSGKDFCAYLHRLTGVVEYPVLRLVWKAIMQYGPRWLAEEKKPIDLGFVRLIPVPYRANWKSIMSARFPQARAMMENSYPKPARRAALEAIGFIPELFNTALAALHRKDHFCYWNVEAVTTLHWWRATEKYESYKRGQLSPTRYAEYWRRGIKKMLPHIMEAYREWCDWLRLPCAQLDEGALFGSRRLIPWVPQGRITPAAPQSGDTYVVVDPKCTDLKGPPATGKVRTAPKGVLELSDILPEPRHVRLLPGLGRRAQGQNLPKPENNGAGTDGVPLLHDREGQDSGGNLLAEGSGI